MVWIVFDDNWASAAQISKKAFAYRRELAIAVVHHAPGAPHWKAFDGQGAQALCVDIALAGVGGQDADPQPVDNGRFYRFQ